MDIRWCLSTTGSAEYILPVTLPTSVTTVPSYACLRSWKMYMEAGIKRYLRCAWRPRSSALRDALEGQNQASSEIYLETEIKWTQSYTSGPAWVSLKMDFESEIKWTPRCTWRSQLSELGDALGGRDHVNWGIYLEAMIDKIWSSTWRRLMWMWLIWRRSIWRQWIWRRQIGRHVLWKLRLYSLGNLQLWECRELSITPFAES